MNNLQNAVMTSAIKRLHKADEQLAIALSDLRLIQSGKKHNGDEINRLLNDIEEIKSILADILTVALNREVFGGIDS